jgi:hypothetical protein
MLGPATHPYQLACALPELEARCGLIQLPLEVRDPWRIMLFRRSDGGVPEEFLDRSEIRSGLHKLNGKRVAEAMWVSFDSRDPPTQ